MLKSLQYYAHQINETLLLCKWRGVEDCTAMNFRTSLTDWGVCFTYNDPVNGSEVLKVNQPGRQNGLLLRLNVQQYEYVSGESFGAGFKVMHIVTIDVIALFNSLGYNSL